MTAAALRALHSARMERVDDVIDMALRRYGRGGPFPVDVLIEIRRAMHGPMTLRPPAAGDFGTGDTR